MSTYKLILIYSLGLLLTAFSLVGGAPFFRIFYRHSRPVYFGGLLLLSLLACWFVGGHFLALNLLVIAILILSYEVASVLKRPFMDRVLWTLTLAFAVAGMCVLLWMRYLPDWGLQVGQALEAELGRFESLSSISPEVFMLQLPSGLFIALMLALFLTLLVEKNKRELYNYSNPGFMVWVFLLATLGSFINMPWLGLDTSVLEDVASTEDTGLGRIMASNTLNICLMFYFFQGLAVISTWLRRYKVALFYRVFLYVLIVLQLLVVVSMVGLVDYWLEFRKPKPAPKLGLRRKK